MVSDFIRGYKPLYLFISFHIQCKNSQICKPFFFCLLEARFEIYVSMGSVTKGRLLNLLPQLTLRQYHYMTTANVSTGADSLAYSPEACPGKTALHQATSEQMLA